MNNIEQTAAVENNIISELMTTKIADVPVLAILLILIAFIIIQILFIVLVKAIVRHNKHFSFSLFGKKNDKEEKEKPKSSNNGQLSKSRVSKRKEDARNTIISNIQNHKFFSYIKFKYVGVDYNLVFENYELLIEHGIKHETKELQDFKKMIASHFLSDCIFKYLFESVKTWIDSVISEYSSRMDDDNYVPISLCNIVEYLIHFTKETTRLASLVQLNFDNKHIDGIPPDFVKYFCKIVNRDMTIIQDVMSSIIYITDITWYNKVIEILDMLELVIVYIKDSVDSTLVVLNGQLEKYLEDLKKSSN